MNNFKHKGVTLDLVAPAGGVIAGKTVKIGGIIAVPGTTKPEGQPFAGTVEGVFDVDAKTAQAWTTGATIYWDDTAEIYTTTAGGNAKAGYAVADKEAAAVVGRIKLIPTV